MMMMSVTTFWLRCLLVASLLVPTDGWNAAAPAILDHRHTALGFVPVTTAEDRQHIIRRDEPEVIIHKDFDSTETFFLDAQVELMEELKSVVNNNNNNAQPFATVGRPFDLEEAAEEKAAEAGSPPRRKASPVMRTPKNAHFLFTTMDSSKKMMAFRNDDDLDVGEEDCFQERILPQSWE
jgi:hypothetical protein